MDKQLFFTGITDVALGKDLRKKDEDDIKSASLIIVNSVSYFLAGVSLIFLIAFQINNSISLFWFFISEAIAFILIPILARQGFEKTAKFMLILYADIGIVILSSVFGKEALIQAFFIPVMGLSILLFENEQIKLRYISIIVTVLAFFILDYVIFETIQFSSSGFSLIKWSVLTASFVTTWLIFNTFSEFRQRAEEKTLQLLEKEKMLNKQLREKREQLEEKVKELNLASKKLEKSAKAKGEFLATMSHEIRTPLNAILGMTNLLMQDEPRKDQLEQIEILDFSAKSLLALIDDILDFSKIEAGKIEFEHAEFEINRLLSSIKESFKLSAKKKKINFEVTKSETVPDYLIGDSTRLTQILNNLLSNALKFTDVGKVELKVDVQDDFDENVELIFSVHDTGIGIPEDKIDSIFRSFTQASLQTKRLFGGTGLGLSISRELTERQGGKIWVESEPEKGSTFYVQLNFEKAQVKAASPAPTNGDPIKKDLKGLRVLVVEDNLVNQKVMERFLERWDVEMTMASDGKQALKEIGKKNFDVILMDLQMPEMDGYETTAMIRKMDEPQKRNVPIIALTAAALKEVRENVYASGMNDYVTKPFNPAILRQKLQELI